MGEHSKDFDAKKGSRSRRASPATQFLIGITAALIAVFALSANAQPGALPMSVRAVVDGDTIRVGARRVSLLGIKAPRLGDAYNTEPLARQARDRLSSLVMLRFVRLEYDGPQRGSAYVFTEDGVFVNAEIVRAGLARVAGRPALKRLDALRAAEAEARGARRGVWGLAPR
ncbi:MAG: thermonuclease family protein [Cyanobacteria bacterium]|nr:thermonuclease family protein [Cyanobacteriota bacterium]